MRLVDPHPDRSAEPAPATPGIPSFDSLRGPRRRSPVDVLVPGDARPPAAPRPAPPRPPEWPDLLPLAMRVAGSLVAAPARLVLWAAHQPVRAARRLLGA